MADSSETSEESSDWEVTQHSHNQQPSSPAPPQTRPLDYELIIRDNFFDDGSPIFPPSEHEDLPLLEEDCSSSRTMSPSQTPQSSSSSDTGLPQEQQIKSYSRLPTMRNGIWTRMHTVGRRVFQGVLSKRCSSLVSGAAIMVVLFACMKFLQWRNRLLLLLREKDQRISQLLHQIAQLNEILSARRKVPVLVEKPG